MSRARRFTNGEACGIIAGKYPAGGKTMIKLEMELSDIDYEVLVKEILPKVADRLKQNGSPLAPLLSGGMAACSAARLRQRARPHGRGDPQRRRAAPDRNARKARRRQRHSLQGAGPARDRRTKIRDSICIRSPRKPWLSGAAPFPREQKSPKTEVFGEKCRIRIIVPPLLRGVRRRRG